MRIGVPSTATPTVSTNDGYTQIDATFGISGYFSAKVTVRRAKSVTDSTESLQVSVVRSTAERQNL